MEKWRGRRVEGLRSPVFKAQVESKMEPDKRRLGHGVTMLRAWVLEGSEQEELSLF